MNSFLLLPLIIFISLLHQLDSYATCSGSKRTRCYTTDSSSKLTHYSSNHQAKARAQALSQIISSSTSLSAAVQKNIYNDNRFLTPPSESIEATGIGAFAENLVKGIADVFTTQRNEVEAEAGTTSPVTMALKKIQKDMKILDEAAGNTAQLTTLETAILGLTVLASASSPLFFSSKVVELLVPSMAALSAAVGISAEYSGKVSVSTGKEIAAAAIQAAAEAEGILAGN
jgi:hypothetical protein